MEEFEKVKVIITTKKYLLFFDTIDKIYFDTYGKYPFLKEAETKSDWDIKYKDNFYGCIKITIANKSVQYMADILCDGDKAIGFNDNKKLVFYITKLKENIYEVRFLKTLFLYDDVFCIVDKLLRQFHYLKYLK